MQFWTLLRLTELWLDEETSMHRVETAVIVRYPLTVHRQDTWDTWEALWGVSRQFLVLPLLKKSQRAQGEGLAGTNLWGRRSSWWQMHQLAQLTHLLRYFCPIIWEERECLNSKAPWKVWRELTYPAGYPYVSLSLAHGWSIYALV